MSVGDMVAAFVICCAVVEIFCGIALEMNRRNKRKLVDAIIAQANRERNEAHEILRIARLSTDENRVFMVCDTCKQIRTTVTDSDGKAFCLECGNLIAVEE